MTVIYLFYVESENGDVDIRRCRDEIHYMDLLVDIESKAVIVPCDIRWHGNATMPPMRILAVHEENEDMHPHARDIVRHCALWLRQN